MSCIYQKKLYFFYFYYCFRYHIKLFTWKYFGTYYYNFLVSRSCLPDRRITSIYTTLNRHNTWYFASNG